MTRSNKSAKPLALLAVALLLAVATSAQQAPAPKPAMKAKGAKAPRAARAVPHPKAASTVKPPSKANPEESSAPAAPATDGTSTEMVGKRDPFAPLINEKKDAVHLPPGKAGLVIATVRVDGAVRSGSSMIAVVSNPEQSVYFIREGDKLYDGDVEKIGLDGVTFKEQSKDAFGKPVERMVTKRIYASAGEQQ
jgi:Tfp pilus assembly protein PilP